MHFVKLEKNNEKLLETTLSGSQNKTNTFMARKSVYKTAAASTC